MTDYKVGDRIRITKNYANNPRGSYFVGLEGTIIGIHTYIYMKPDMVPEIGMEEIPLTENEIELIKENKTMTTLALIANTSGCTIVVDGTVTTIANDHPNFEAIQDAYAQGDSEAVLSLMSIRKTLEAYTDGNIRIEGDRIFYGNRNMSAHGLGKRIIKLMADGREGFAQPLINFMENLMLNPSFRAVEGLYEWLEKSSLPITPDGYFIAWKIVREDFKDHHTGKFDNSPGCVVEIPRNQVNEDPNQICSSGLHFCSNEYLPQYGGFFGSSSSRIMMVKVNPKDVGAFPKDYNISKGRCCRYQVVKEVTSAEIEAVSAPKASAVFKTDTVKVVDKIETRSQTTRQEIDLVFADGSRQKTKVRLGDTIDFTQKGDIVTLQPSGRTVKIV